jgi:hypothetical protein
MPTNRASMPNKKGNRVTALAQYISSNNIAVMPSGRMRELTARFSSFANTVQTRLNSSNGTGGALGGTLEAQVERALSQTLRRPGALATAVEPRPGDSSIAAMVGGSGGSQPAMSPYQATMLREARIVQADILSMLDNVQPLSPFTDPGDVASLQSLVRAEVNALLEEFSYTRLLPRQQRVRVLLGGLLGWDYDSWPTVTSPLSPLQNAPAGDIQALVNLLNLGAALIPTISVEDQLASQQILGSDGALFDAQWTTFWNNGLNRLGPGGWALWEPGVAVWSPAPPPNPVNPPGITGVPGGLGSLLPPASITGLAPAGSGAGSVTSSTSVQVIAFGPGSPQLTMQAPWKVGVIYQSTPAPVNGLSFAEKMIQADLLLPVIAQDASRVADSLTAIGFTAGEQETTFATFWSAVDGDLLPTLGTAIPGGSIQPPPSWTVLNGLQTSGDSGTTTGIPTPIPVYMTVADIVDWAQNLAGPNSADLLRNAGALGLNLLCDQADELFWLALAMLDPTILGATPATAGRPSTGPITALADTEVQLEVASLATDLNTLANLAY